MKKWIISTFFIIISLMSFAQIKGVIFSLNDGIKTPLYGAKIKLLNAEYGTVTNEEGLFEIILPKNLPDTLVFSAFGYNSDTIIVDKKDRFISMEIHLYSDQMLPEVIITAKKADHSISKLKTLLVEEINAGELRKAACCNLSESFETNVSVDVNLTDGVSGAKKIQMMGLDGVYTQIQLENIPYLRGLESSFGLNAIPGTWIESIQITKGTGNVVNGYESMAGLVNLELKKPQEMEQHFLNAYVSIYGRGEINYNGSSLLNSKWSTAYFAHASAMQGEPDNNNDGFRDVPKGSNLAFLNRWNYSGKKMESQIGLNAYRDEKQGGQVASPSNSNVVYLVQTLSQHVDLLAKTGFFLKKPMQSIGVVYNLKLQDLQSKFGLRSFYGLEKRAYANAIYDGYINNTNHKFKAGASFVYIDLEQSQDNLRDNRTEYVPGIFGEYTYTGMRLTSVFGVRADYHNLFEWQFSPRIHAKYILSEKTDLRVTAGKGWRVPNYMIDNISLLANNKTWIAPAKTEAEISWNIGGSLVQAFQLFKHKASINFDFYHTQFQNQLVVDRDQNEFAIEFYYLKNRSFSNSFQTEFSFNIIKNLEVRMAYKYLDVKAEFNNELQAQVMIPKHRSFLNLNYKSRNKKWEYDATCSVYGASRLPTTYTSLGYFSLQSDVYPILNAQITYVARKWEFYVGGENLTNFMQSNAIIDAPNPFGNKFDASQIWGPVMGINIYAGVRYTLKKKKE